MITEQIKYSNRIESTTLLGPGERAVLWVHGCCFDCPGCIGTEYKSGSGKSEGVENLVDWFLGTGRSELTISGGEPMLQARELSKMVREIRLRKEVGVIVYTGFVYEELKKTAEVDKGINSFLNDIDILIDGPYVEKMNDDQPYRGSSNQRIIPLTDRYKDVLNSYYYQSNGRKIEIRLSDQQTFMVGVPSKDQAQIWGQVKSLGEQRENIRSEREEY